MKLSSLPPTGLVLFSVLSIQIGAGLATQLFPVLGAEGTVAIRIIISALFLVVLTRSKLSSLKQTFLKNTRLLIGFGLCMAAMNLFFYMSIDRIPLGAAVAIEFIGPLGVAALKSKRFIHFLWVALAALGILLLSPLTGLDLDPFGILLALLAGSGWALYMVLADPVGKRASGNDGLVIAVLIAAIVMMPYAIPATPDLFSSWNILLVAFGVALLSTTIPFCFEFEALQRMPARNYGILVSVEPAVAALVGALLLSERIGVQGMVAVACVVVAAIGITVSDKNERKASSA